jgi:hypothetical protein
MLAGGAPAPASSVTAARGALPSSCRFPGRAFDALTFTYLLRYVDGSRRVLRRSSRGVVRPGDDRGARVRGAQHGVWRPLLGSSTYASGFPARAASSRRVGARSAASWGPSIRGFYESYPEERLLELWWDAGRPRRARTPAEPGRRHRDMGTAGVSATTRPAFYALAPGGWRDYVTLLHPPYTAWHLSYVVIGAALAPEWRPGILMLALARSSWGWESRPTRSTSCRGAPCRRASGDGRCSCSPSSRCSAPPPSGSAPPAHGPLAARVRRRGGVHRHRVQPRAVRRRVPQHVVVRARLGRAAGARDVLRRSGNDPRRGDLRRCLRGARQLDAARAVDARPHAAAAGGRAHACGQAVRAGSAPALRSDWSRSPSAWSSSA